MNWKIPPLIHPCFSIRIFMTRVFSNTGKHIHSLNRLPEELHHENNILFITYLDIELSVLEESRL